MPKSRTQKSNRKSNGASAVGPVWPATTSTPELRTYAVSNGNYALYHNVGVAMTNVVNLFDSITQGVGFGQRVGNRIFAKRLRARIVFNNKTDRPNCSYRVACTAAPTNSNTDSFGELFTGGFTGIHKSQCSLLYHDATFPLNQGSGMENNATPNKERSFNHTIDIPINRAVVYNDSDGKATTCLSVWFCAYDAYGTLQSDNIASVAQVSWLIDYTDS